MLDVVRDGEYAGKGNVWMALDLGKSCVWADWERKGVVP